MSEKTFYSIPVCKKFCRNLYNIFVTGIFTLLEKSIWAQHAVEASKAVWSNKSGFVKLINAVYFSIIGASHYVQSGKEDWSHITWCNFLQDTAKEAPSTSSYFPYIPCLQIPKRNLLPSPTHPKWKLPLHCSFDGMFWQDISQAYTSKKAYTHSGTSCSQCVYQICRHLIWKLEF